MEQAVNKKLPLKIVYVEDDPYIRENTFEILNRRIETVYAATNGQEGLDLFYEHKPDVVITDIRMPRLDGLAMASEIRKENPRQHIIIISAYNETEYLTQAIELGVDSFVLKPLHWPRLYEALKRTSQAIWFDQELATKNRLIAEKQALLESMINSSNKTAFISADTSKSVSVFNRVLNTWLLNSGQSAMKTRNPLLPLWDTMPKEHPLYTLVEKTLNGEPVVAFEDSLWDATGKLLFEVNCWPIRGASKNSIAGISLMITDISDKQESRAQLNQYKLHLEDLVKVRTDELLASEFRYKNLVERLNDGLMITTGNSIVLANAALGKLIGTDPAQLVGRDLLSLFRHGDAEMVNHIHQHRIQGDDVPDIYETHATTFSGETLPVELNVSRVNPDDNSSHIVLVRDLSHRNALEKERNKLASAVGQIGEGVVITSNQGVIEYVNDSFCRITGYSDEEVIGKNISLLSSGEHTREFYQNLWKTITSGSNWTGVIINRRKDGTHYHEHCLISPVSDSFGNIVNYVAVKRDITNEMAIEKKMRQTQKLQAIGNLAGGIAHDFNNLLMGMSVYTELAINELPPDSHIREYLTQVRQEQLRARTLIQKILLFSRQQEEEVMHEIKIKETALGFIDMLRVTLPPTINMDVEVEESGRMLLDPTLFQQILINLCTNASHAMQGRGTLTIRIKTVSYQRPGAEAAPHLHIRVSDTGCGIDPKIQDRVFEPFFTTKPVGEGTGLGLASVHGIVEKCNGAIDLISEVGKGTTFNIYLPINNPK